MWVINLSLIECTVRDAAVYNSCVSGQDIKDWYFVGRDFVHIYTHTMYQRIRHLGLHCTGSPRLAIASDVGILFPPLDDLHVLHRDFSLSEYSAYLIGGAAGASPDSTWVV
jgi:hypothetical protein